ncbi:LysM peptidoglycan-binding domain-containing protein [Sutcliffiella horikoshii]|uniref:LysM peptidoglycan-binding domain-containing protein n=1 Tax=Sutcliffiella horikoshii TaxID=79883 RepID=UPI00385151A4
MVESQNIRSRKERIETQKRINKGKRDKKIVSYVLAGTLAVSAFITVNARGEVLANEALHQVKPGDTLFSLAQKYGVSVKELKELNGLKSDIIKVGQILQLSETGSKEVEENKKSTHEVSSGDTLFSIAKKYGLTVTELKQVNNLKTDLIKMGQVLKVGGATTSYKVMAGDTLFSISEKFDVTVGSIQKENNLTTDTIRIGQQLIIPPSNHQSVEKAQEKVTKAFYTVAPGETLWGIAKKFNMSAHKIKKDNHMSSEYVLIGQELKIQTDGMIKANAVITGVVDRNSVEFLIEGEKEPVVLRVAYGTAPNYDIISGAELSIIYKKGISPVLVDLVFANEEFGY